ncbi:hypothetical protein BZ13_221 [Francisella philomiragia subsp. philomiragia ATCC 25015]|uniref:DUF1634 domain-containing protein n=1 Tax=Francisella philomiragia TaxID=28110 RepID=UPI0001AF77F1|nr:DUF1634 domain-containing protein [Francisella philomiragia]AJI74715.1 hypothetical protein BZ13_221 [Francisella philomiragia subsp. philomiragia ATCC 25015]EET21521.1 conserved hypothetical protein [Francisella philomiragia subsp. philomiragia ATCC 25015]MBK2237950.1 DUF1634 domain-containing protein [Francisella philomiragia]
MIKDNVIYRVIKLNLSLAVFIICLGAVDAILVSPYVAKNIVNLGIFLIIITPVLRILLEFIFFIKAKNFTYMLICLLLFLIIAVSIVC